MSELIEQGYVQAAKLVANEKSNFAAVFKSLSPNRRKSMIAFYVFCRKSFAIAECSESTETKKEQLAELTNSARESLSGRGTEDPIVSALTDTVNQFEIPHQYIFDLLRGVSRDLEPVSHSTYADLKSYCYFVASSVGLSALHIWGFDSTNEKYLRPILDCGIAIQMTKILRDIHQDFNRKRIYIPKEDWVKRDLDLDCQIEPFSDVEWKELIQFECRRAQNLFHCALNLQSFLDRPGRKAVRNLIGKYWAILKKIRRDPIKILREKIELTSFEKIKINAQAVAGFPAMKIPLSNE